MNSLVISKYFSVENFSFIVHFTLGQTEILLGSPGIIVYKLEFFCAMPGSKPSFLYPGNYFYAVLSLVLNPMIKSVILLSFMRWNISFYYKSSVLEQLDNHKIEKTKLFFKRLLLILTHIYCYVIHYTFHITFPVFYLVLMFSLGAPVCIDSKLQTNQDDHVKGDFLKFVAVAYKN